MKRLGLVVSGLALLSSPAWAEGRAERANKANKLGAECRAGKAKSCRELAHFARNDPDWSLRRAAVKDLTDQAVLADVAKSDGNDVTRALAVGRLTDQALLARIANNDNVSDVRQAAVKNPTLTDQALLADIAKNDKNTFVRDAAVEKLTDQAALAEVAKNEKEWPARIAAVEKVADPTLLVEIAKNAAATDVRLAAVEMLEDQASLVEIGTTADDPRVRSAAVRKSGLRRVVDATRPFRLVVVNDLPESLQRVFDARSVLRELFGALLTDESSESVLKVSCAGRGLLAPYRSAARPGFVESIESGASVSFEVCLQVRGRDSYWCRSFSAAEAPPPSLSPGKRNPAIDEAFAKLLREVVAFLPDMLGHNAAIQLQKSRDERVRSAALVVAGWQARWADTARSDADVSARRQAVEKLTDQTMLAQIARNDPDPSVREDAVGRLTDPTVLADIARKGSDGGEHRDDRARRAAVANPRLTDMTLILAIAKNEEDRLVRVAAVGRLTDQALLAHIARNDKDEWVRLAAVRNPKLTTVALLREVANSDPVEGVRQAAVWRVHRWGLYPRPADQ